MENIRTVVCNNFNRLVDSSGMTKREIAHQMNISEATLQRWKSGASFPELPNLEKLAKILNVHEREFYAYEEPVVRQLPVSHALKKMMSVPDDVYDMAIQLQELKPKDREAVWKNIKEEMVAALAQNDIQKA